MSEISAEKGLPPLDTIMARANIIWCSRCANQSEDDPRSFAQSWEGFRRMGWTYDAAVGRVFCPQCSTETTRPLPPGVRPTPAASGTETEETGA